MSSEARLWQLLKGEQLLELMVCKRRTSRLKHVNKIAVVNPDLAYLIICRHKAVLSACSLHCNAYLNVNVRQSNRVRGKSTVQPPSVNIPKKWWLQSGSGGPDQQYVTGPMILRLRLRLARSTPRLNMVECLDSTCIYTMTVLPHLLFATTFSLQHLGSGLYDQ